MPIYEYQCRCGKKYNVFHKINRVPKKHRCSCGWMAKKVLSAGAILPDGNVSWLPSACQVLQRHGEPPLQSRGEYKKYLLDNKLQCIG